MEQTTCAENNILLEPVPCQSLRLGHGHMGSMGMEGDKRRDVEGHWHCLNARHRANCVDPDSLVSKTDRCVTD